MLPLSARLLAAPKQRASPKLPRALSCLRAEKGENFQLDRESTLYSESCSVGRYRIHFVMPHRTSQSIGEILVFFRREAFESFPPPPTCRSVGVRPRESELLARCSQCPFSVQIFPLPSAPDPNSWKNTHQTRIYNAHSGQKDPCGTRSTNSAGG